MRLWAERMWHNRIYSHRWARTAAMDIESNWIPGVFEEWRIIIIYVGSVVREYIRQKQTTTNAPYISFALHIQILLSSYYDRNTKADTSELKGGKRINRQREIPFAGLNTSTNARQSSHLIRQPMGDGSMSLIHFSFLISIYFFFLLFLLFST